MKLTFHPDNGIRVHFDFISFYDNVPDGVEFDVEPRGEDGAILRACGFGCLEKHSKTCYGNGALYASRMPFRVTKAAP